INIIKKKTPEVLILDVEFDNEDWLNHFYPILKKCPINTIILSDFNPDEIKLREGPDILKSYDYILKPNGVWKDELPKIKDEIISKILAVNLSKNHRIDNKIRLNTTIPTSEPRLEEYFLEVAPVIYTKLNFKIVVIGASVGGPRTLRMILSEIPRDFPIPILVVQHLNHFFMRQFVVSLKSVCKLNVRIGANYEDVLPGNIYFSPGDKHMQVTVKNNKPYIRTFEGEPVNFCRPSVDVLFYSTARIFKEKTLGVLLTGMGRDGVAGLRAIKSEGGKTIAESEETSILYGMPKVAAETGAADLILPNYKIVDEILNFKN
ncbi:MAG: CheB methylesterase domain-containing protein, partial [Candidatus Hodarchaeales archaeon]